MERRTFTRSLLAVPLGVAALSAAPLVAADDGDDGDDDERRSRRDPFANIPIQGAGANGAAFRGVFTLRGFDVNQAGQLVAVGPLAGILTRPGGARQPVRLDSVQLPAMIEGLMDAPAAGAMRAAQAACPVLNLVLGPLNLDLLGLTISLNQVVLDITAVPGAGNLLGNLLCALVGLLDGVDLAGRLAALASFLNALLALLRA